MGRRMKSPEIDMTAFLARLEADRPHRTQYTRNKKQKTPKSVYKLSRSKPEPSLDDITKMYEEKGLL